MSVRSERRRRICGDWKYTPPEIIHFADAPEKLLICFDLYDIDETTRRPDIERMIDIVKMLLTEKQYNYLLDYFGRGMSYPEMMKKYGVDRSTISHSINAAMRKLKSKIEKIEKYKKTY